MIETASGAVKASPISPYAPQPFLRNTWYVAMWAQDLQPGKLVPRTILGESLVFFRREDGTAAALMDRCAHRFAPLHLGRIVGDRVQCAYHGVQFDCSGACVHNPHGSGAIPPAMRVRSFPAVEKHSCIWVWMGDRAADPATIPDFSVIDNAPEAHITRRDQLVVRANYQLLSDNLLDLSHAIYLHDGILSNSDNAGASVEVVEKAGAVTVSRFAANARIPALHRSYWPHATDVADKFSSIRWTAPSTLLLKQGVCLPGDGIESGTGYYGIHLLTPETATSTAYYFTAVRFNVQTPPSADEGLNEKLATTRRFAFAEQDAPVIEAQQRAIEAAGEPPVPTLLAIDAGPVRCKRILDRLIAAD